MEDRIEVIEDNFSKFFSVIVFSEGEHGEYMNSAMFLNIGGGWVQLGHRTQSGEGKVTGEAIDVLPPKGEVHEAVRSEVAEQAAVRVDLRQLEFQNTGSTARGDYFVNRLWKRLGKSKHDPEGVVGEIRAELAHVRGEAFQGYTLEVDEAEVEKLRPDVLTRVLTRRVIDDLEVGNANFYYALTSDKFGDEVTEWIEEAEGFFSNEDTIQRVTQLVNQLDLDPVDTLKGVVEYIIEYKTGTDTEGVDVEEIGDDGTEGADPLDDPLQAAANVLDVNVEDVDETMAEMMAENAIEDSGDDFDNFSTKVEAVVDLNGGIMA